MKDVTIVLCLLAFVFGYLISSHINMTIEGAACDDDKTLKKDPITKHYYPRQYFDGDNFFFNQTPNGCLDTSLKCSDGPCYKQVCNKICGKNPKNVNLCEITFKQNHPTGCIMKGSDTALLMNPKAPPTGSTLTSPTPTSPTPTSPTPTSPTPTSSDIHLSSFTGSFQAGSTPTPTSSTLTSPTPTGSAFNRKFLV